MFRTNYLLIILLLATLLSSCSKEEKQISIIKETSQDLEIQTAYKEAYESLDAGDQVILVVRNMRRSMVSEYYFTPREL